MYKKGLWALQLFKIPEKNFERALFSHYVELKGMLGHRKVFRHRSMVQHHFVGEPIEASPYVSQQMKV